MKNTRRKYVTVDILDRHFFQNLHIYNIKDVVIKQCYMNYRYKTTIKS